jgi:hypothetical protein
MGKRNPTQRVNNSFPSLKKVMKQRYNHDFRQKQKQLLSAIHHNIAQQAFAGASSSSAHIQELIQVERNLGLNPGGSAGDSNSLPIMNSTSNAENDNESGPQLTSTSNVVGIIEEDYVQPASSSFYAMENQAASSEGDLEEDDEHCKAKVQIPPDFTVEISDTSRNEQYACMLAYKISHNLSDAAMQTYLDLENSRVKHSWQKLPKTYATVKNLCEKMVPIRREWITYCPFCLLILKQSFNPLRRDLSCPDCDKEIPIEKIVSGQCYFVLLSIRAQLKSFLEAGKLPILLSKTKKIQRATVKGPLHDGLEFPKALDLTMGCDAAPLTKRSKISIFPIVLFINNIPVTYQLRFPILAALFCGRSHNVPPAHVMFELVVKELKELGLNPIKWECGSKKFETKVFVTLCQSDAKQKAELMNIYGTSGRYSCPYCYSRGWAYNKTTEGKGSTSSKIIFHHLVESRRCAKRRTEAEFRSQARVGARFWQEHGKPIPSTQNKGVKSFPVYFGHDHFDLIFSNTPDTLHVVCEGFLKQVLVQACDTKGRRYSFRRVGGTFEGQFCLLYVLYVTINIPAIFLFTIHSY